MTSRPSFPLPFSEALSRALEAELSQGAFASAEEALKAGLSLLRQKREAAALRDARAFPLAGGECGALIRALDWAHNPVGALSLWSDVLRATITNIVNSPVAKMLFWGPDHILFYNDAFSRIAGDRHPCALGIRSDEAFPELWAWQKPVLEQALHGQAATFRNRHVRFDHPHGRDSFTLDLYYTPVFETDGHAAGVLCTVVDNTERVKAEARLAASEANLLRVTNATPMLVSYVDQAHIYRFANAAYETLLGLKLDSIINRPVSEVLGARVYEDRRPDLERALSGQTITAETLLPQRDGTLRHTEFRYVPHTDGEGVVHGVHILGIDIEERARRIAEVAASDLRFRTAMRAVHGVLWTNSADGRMTGEQPGWAALTGQSYDAYQGFGWANAVHPDDAAATIVAWNTSVTARSMFVHEHRVLSREGVWRNFAIRALPILNDEGVITEWVGVHSDITHQRAAEAALRERADDLARQVSHRQRAEEQLRKLNETLENRVIEEIAERRQAETRLAQAQKMESIGKLTGGVAHDFNNLLQVISGNLQLLGKDVAGNARAERHVSSAMGGVQRGSRLASQLLAFGRRQALEPKIVNVTRFVRGMDEMLRRAIGEGIEIETVVSAGLWNTFIDPAQIENALLNLAINARDAMDGHGKLTIELGNALLDDSYVRQHDDVKAGQYVLLAVSDTGTGMTPEILSKVFEPFFSTKAEGKGSGLGLSMVYGFVKQSGGHINIYSEPDEGTTIKLYLPRSIDAEDVETDLHMTPATGGTERVLVVEDDDEVRATVVEMLSDLGYQVLKATDAANALVVIESGIPIDMLFTDVVMPGTLKSPELARRAKERLPDIAVLFTSGYTENSIVHGGRLDAGVELLSKPYTRDAWHGNSAMFLPIVRNVSRRLIRPYQNGRSTRSLILPMQHRTALPPLVPSTSQSCWLRMTV
ncbi:PAS domain-containing hybrid sensor histidine kinase/response regulator [Asaia prunellae]|uniref:PAS domain-containing hybrid sensor histidine kinase/response regulator n=1 Tax=Asaia prunellae TaxID=610245 RepID=UPI000AE8F523|nr:PAS domain-containing protein [Asaia prunellae]